jgi:LysR family glycine cleavage system transcriptional activator
MANWLPSLNALRAFEATARHGSYKKAADELAVTPAAVKQLVAKLEEAMGEPLLNFHGRQMELSKIGAQGYSDLSSAFQQISAAVQRMRDSCESDYLVVTVEPSIASAWLVPRLQSFKKLHPEIDILVDSSMKIVDLERGAADIGIRYGVEENANLITERLFHESMSAFCSPGLAAGPPAITRLEDLQNAPLLRWDVSGYEWARTTLKWNFWHNWLSAVGASHVTPGSGIKYTDYNQAVQAAVAGQGFLLGSQPILSGFIDSGLLLDPFNIAARPAIGYDLVTTRLGYNRPKVRKFLDWIVEEAKEASSRNAA